MMVAAALTASWLETTPAPAPAQDTAPRQSSRASGGRRDTRLTAASVPDTGKLREYIAVTPLPPGGRNPFVFGARTPARSAAPSERETIVAPPAMEPLPPPLPVFRLSGIASNTENGAAVLTAIVIDNGTMVFAKAGDRLSNGYVVVRVEEMSVTLADATGVTQTIRLP
jgi:hypothetical protein